MGPFFRVNANRLRPSSDAGHTTPLYVIHHDGDCRHCGEVHGYVTQGCHIVCFIDFGTTLRVCEHHHIPLVNIAVVDPTDDVMGKVLGAYVLNITRNGKPDDRYPRNASLPSRRS